MEHHHAINGKTHYKWYFSIAMLVYQRVSPSWKNQKNDTEDMEWEVPKKPQTHHFAHLCSVENFRVTTWHPMICPLSPQGNPRWTGQILSRCVSHSNRRCFLTSGAFHLRFSNLETHWFMKILYSWIMQIPNNYRGIFHNPQTNHQPSIILKLYLLISP